ncbi:hypothetical protein [Thiocapsa marina]|uniref:hypothetical protein n=1 Tax=Thiocapsa marina TaxID=244573 RepID=UPI0011120774|nr:hypothetical protein [Thiocapsa marina]
MPILMPSKPESILAARNTERTWIFRQSGCIPQTSGHDAPIRRSAHDGEEEERRPGVRGARNAATNRRALGIFISPGLGDQSGGEAP